MKILSFAQAQEAARNWFHVETRKAAGLPEKSSGSSTVGDALDAYLSWFANNRKSLAETKAAIEAHIRPALGEVEVDKLTTRRIRQWLEAVAASPPRTRTRMGEAQRHREPPIDSQAVRARRATANRVMTVLKAALNYVHSEQKIGDPDSWNVKPFQRVAAARVRYLSEDESRRLLNACSPDFRQMVMAALVTGCRYGELCRAEVGDLDQDARALIVRESKTDRPRWVPLDDEAAAFLSEIAAGRPRDARLLLRADGKPWGRSHQKRPLQRACSAARIDPPASFHMLRHTWASHRAMRGVPLLAIATVLGHSDTRMVERHYGHLAPNWLHDQIRRSAMDLGMRPNKSIVLLQRAAG